MSATLLKPAGTTEPAPDPVKEPRTETSYVVLELSKPDTSWKMRATLETRSAEAAVKQYAESVQPPTEMTLVTVPARSWKPVTVRPQTVTTLLIEEL